VSLDPGAENLLRRHAPQVLGALVRRYGHFDAAEDAVQEALLAGAVQWPRDGVPDDPRGWLIRVASRRLADQLRSDEARRRREEADAALTPPGAFVVAPPGEEHGSSWDDDTLTLLFLCCHPDLPPPTQVALTLRAVGGLTTAEIARALLLPEATVAQRISRAKQRLRASGVHFRDPPEAQRGGRLAAVLQVLYLIFNEGYTASSGPSLQRADLASEALRLTREVRSLLPRDGEVAGLLALMLLTDARRAARTGPSGELIPLDEQDRSRWDAEEIEEGTALVEYALRHARPGPYQVQAAIAALHDEAGDAADTDWPQILALYEVLDRTWPSPVVSLNHAVAVAMVRGPEFGLALLDRLEDDPHLARGHRLAAARGHLLERAGHREQARAAYREASRRTLSGPERRYLLVRAARLG
jgi:RNA polymerase sigma factor (sigma-70 family)